ncbi:MAG: hypothetical protein AAFQ54_02940 [Pseudomonadota bacterium]
MKKKCWPALKELPEEMQKSVDDLLSERVSRNAGTMRITKHLAVAIGSFVTVVFGAAAAFTTWPPSRLQIVLFSLIIFGALAALFGAAIGALTDEDPTEAIDQARREKIAAEKHQALANQRLDKLKKYDAALKELKSLYLVVNSCRSVLETNLRLRNCDPVPIIDDCLAACRHDLRVALSFEMSDFWTVCVYRADKIDGQDFLTCVAHLRSVDCDIRNARRWKAGEGMAGVTWTKNAENVEPDAFAATSGTSHLPNTKNVNVEDDGKYRSLFAVPITLEAEADPWGVIVATSSNALHFGNPSVEGVAPEEAIRALSGIVALAVTGTYLSTEGRSE